MSATQKMAWFNLAVVICTLAVVLVLLPIWGRGATGGFGFLGLIGFGPLFFRKRPGQVLEDERDRLIRHRSWIVAYVVFWVTFVLAAGVGSAAAYGANGQVPVWVVQTSTFCGLMLVYAVASIAALVQYVAGFTDAG